jgi:hypothetical protein
MKRYLPNYVGITILIVAILLSSKDSYSQSITTGNGKLEIGVGFGPLIFLGDLGGTQGTGKTFLKDVNFPVTNFSKGIYINLYPVEWLGFRLAANHGVLEGYDSLIKDKGGREISRKMRNLQFRSPMTEVFLAAEFYPTVFLESFSGLKGKMRPYGLIGIGAFRFNPKGEYISPNGTRRWVDLKPLRLEGQGMDEYPNHKPYSLTAFEVPMGVGFKYFFSDNKFIGLEILHRVTSTDYIDDVSKVYINANLFDKYLTPENAQMAKQLYFRENLAGPLSRSSTPALNEQRGDPKENDSYFSSILRLGWRLIDNNSPSGRAARQLRCPVFY